MTILVTGAAGFIGSHVVNRLLADGHSVVGVDNMNPYYDPALKRARLAQFKDSITFVEADIADLDALSAVFETHAFDLVYHIAAQPGVRYSLSHPLVYVRSNELGTGNVLELARLNGKPPIVFASSSSVYGRDAELPFSEDKPVGEPLSVYAATKQAGEALCAAYSLSFGMPITVLRFFTVYGPWGRPDMAVFSFTEKILKDEIIELYEMGNLKRDFTYIDDILDGCIRAMEHFHGFRVFNLGRGETVPVVSLVGILEKATGKQAHTRAVPFQKGDMRETWANINKAKK